MLFGFRGHWNGVIDTTANGEVSVGLIQMRVSIASPDIFSGVVDIVPFYYEADVNSGGTPLNISLNGTFVSAATTTNRSGFIREGTYSLPTDGYGAATLSGSRTFGSQYVEPISPLTRRNRFNISRPDLIEAIDITTLSNNGGKSNTSNQQRNINFDDYSRFTNLKYISFNEGYISGMTGNLPNSLEYLRIGEQPVLRNIPKINNGLKHFILNETAIPTSAITYTLSGVSTLETLNFINFSPYPSVNANIQQLSNNLDLITNTSLKNLYIINKSSGDIFLHNNHNQWVDFYVRNSMYTNIGYINSLFTGSTVRDLFIDGNGLSWNRNIDSDDINNNMRYCYLYSTNISGNCIITDNKPNLIDFRLGNNTLRSGVQLNSHPIVNISGLTACETIDLSGCNVEELELPVNTVCTSLILLDNRLDIGINPNLVAKINAMTALVTLQLSNSTNFSGGAATGQNSTNGLGANPDLSSLVNATTIFIGSCKITGILTLPNVNKLTQLTVSENTGLTSIANIAPHVSLLLFRAINCPALVIANLATFPVATTFQAGKCTFTLSDYSTRTSATEINLDLRECVFSSGDFIFPSVAGRFQIPNNGNLLITDSPTLTALTNSEFITVQSLTNSTTFNVSNCAINQIIPFGQNSFLPRTMLVQGNGMNVTNVDGTIDSIYQNSAKWDRTVVHILNIAGTNATPSGSYAAPSGYIQADGVTNGNDGSPVSAKEQMYVLVNQNVDLTTTKKYNWTITTS